VERAVGIGGTLVVAATISIIGQASLRAAAKGVREVIAGDVGFVKREWTAMRERLRGSSPTPAPAAPDGSDAPTQPPAASSERAREALARAVAEVTGLPETEIEKLKGVIGAQADLIGFEAHEASELAQEVRALREENRDLRRESAETLHVVRGLSIRLERLEASRKESLRMQEEIVADLGNGGAPTTIH
jgi:hypothetical protein